MTHRSLLDYLGEPTEPEDRPTPETDAVDELHERLAELEARLKNAGRTNRAEEQPEPPLSSQIESILNRRDALAPERQSQARRESASPREAARFVESRPERVNVQAPPLAPEAAAASGDFGRFVDAVQLIAQAANRYLQQQPRPEPNPPAPARHGEFAAIFESLKEVLGALNGLTEEFRSAADEMRRSVQDQRRPAEERHSTARRISRDDAELYRLQDDLDELRERLASVTRRRSRNPY